MKHVGTTASAQDIATQGQVLAVAEVLTPVNTSPAQAATGVTEIPTLTGSGFYGLYGATHAATQVQVSTSSNFTAPLYSSGDQAGSVSCALPAGYLVVGTTYWWRMRFKNSRGIYSDWSTATSFTTSVVFASYIAAPTATPSAFGDPLEGGFYAGLIWNELVQSATSATIGTGSKAFAVADMTSMPLVYAGQTLEVRSSANPDNKMTGTVTGALGTTLTLNVTSVSGAGTFTDWSVMSRYRIITAPKASGQAGVTMAYKNANTAAPAACMTLSEGRKATLAMVAADSSTVYPAAWYCYGLSIGGKADWYLPSRDETELIWRNLKPVTVGSFTGPPARPASSATGTLGSYGDTSTAHGVNPNSSPTGVAYSTAQPTQVAAGKNFREGETEAITPSPVRYWTSSEYASGTAWWAAWYAAAPGYQDIPPKTESCYVRAVRRSII